VPEVAALVILYLVDDRLPQIGTVVVDLAPAWMGGGEGVLHQILAEVTGAAHQVGKPDQREPMLPECLLEPGRYRLRLIHNQYVVSVTANVASPRNPTMTRDRTRIRSWVVARRIS
jgi:hypothetical protein